MSIEQKLIKEFSLKPIHVENVIQLIDEGNTIPFIARYRKEMTGSLDDQILRELSERLTYLRGLEKRKEEVFNSITEQEKMTPEIEQSIKNAVTMTELEDIYRPFRPKRRTRATVAKEKGLEPLARIIFRQDKNSEEIHEMARSYINEEKDVNDEDEAISGAMDIIAEEISDDPDIRKELRKLIYEEGMIESKASKKALEAAEASVYELYYDFNEGVEKMAGHRILAIDRGEKEEFLKISISINKEKALNILFNKVIINSDKGASGIVRDAAIDSYDRLIFPSVEREIRNELTDMAGEGAIKVFAVNLKNLLMQPPVKGKVTLGLDPAYRTGCKIAVVDGIGRVLDTTVIYPTPPQNKIEEAKAVLKKLIEKHKVEIISIGNGTASKESEIFVADLIKEISKEAGKAAGGSVSYVIVNEAGASVYSASKLAASEFPQYDVSIRSAVSIARRLQDPLSELVKIDPKSIGVGQYQHDMKEARLDEALGGVVENCVNGVGVDLNTASVSLLSYVAGVGKNVAANIVSYRVENGGFNNREELKKVSKLGPKVFIQCAGFLRVSESKNVLDNTCVHPESYNIAKELLKICGYTFEEVKTGNIKDLKDRAEKIGIKNIAERTGAGEPTLRDIMTELLKPGRDPRDELPPPLLRSDVLDMEDLKPGMILKGTVRNVIDFGVFVDIGVHQDGLVHISQICDKYIKHPSEVLKVGDIMDVKVLSVDVPKKRISLSMKNALQ